jgi:hypothetical protein
VQLTLSASLCASQVPTETGAVAYAKPLYRNRLRSCRPPTTHSYRHLAPNGGDARQAWCRPNERTMTHASGADTFYSMDQSASVLQELLGSSALCFFERTFVHRLASKLVEAPNAIFRFCSGFAAFLKKPGRTCRQIQRVSFLHGTEIGKEQALKGYPKVYRSSDLALSENPRGTAILCPESDWRWQRTSVWDDSRDCLPKKIRFASGPRVFVIARRD